MVEDNRQGFDLEKVLGLGSTRGGLGLSSMRERTELSGGSFEIESPSLSPLRRLCRNHDGGWIPTESRRGGIRFLSFRMRSFKVMGNRPS
jgi:hypothetical protein